MNTTTLARLRRASAVTLAFAIPLAVTACGDDSSSKSSDTKTTTTSVQAVSAGITIKDSWARNSPMGAGIGVVYLNIVGGSSDDELVKVAVDPTVAAKAELHETVMGDHSMGDHSMGEMSSSTMVEMSSTTMTSGQPTTTLAPTMKMRPVSSIKIPARKTVSLKPGGYHIMLLDLVEPLELGSTIEVTVTFKNASPQKLTVPVKDAP